MACFYRIKCWKVYIIVLKIMLEYIFYYDFFLTIKRTFKHFYMTNFIYYFCDVYQNIKFFPNIPQITGNRIKIENFLTEIDFQN